LIVLLGSLTAFSPLAIDMYLPAFPQIERDLATTAGAVELTLAAFLIGLSIGQFVIGPISDRTGRRAPLLLGCGAFALAAILCSVASSIEWFIAARFLMGFAGAAGLVVSRAIVRDLFDERTSAGAYSFMMMVTGVAPVVAPLLGSQILALGEWRHVFWTLAGIGVAAALVVALALEESLPVDRRARKSFARILRRSVSFFADRRFLGYGLSIGFSAGAVFAYVGASPGVFMDQFGVSDREFSLLFAGNAVGLFLGAQLNRRLLTRVGPHQILKIATFAAALAGGALVLEAATGLGGFYAFYATLFLCVSSLGLIFPNGAAAAMAPFGAEAGAASAALGLLQYGVGAAAGAAVSALHNDTALPMAAVIAACQIGACLSVCRSHLSGSLA
jgi:DHA1 family bicyclomycin/chloramphenicol resistance-like MFS transporter